MTTNKDKSRERDLQLLQQLRAHLFRSAASRKQDKWTYKKRRSQEAAFNQQKAFDEEMEIANTTTLLTIIFEEEEEEEEAEVKKRSKARERRRNTIEEIYEAYGSNSFKRAYRMSYVSFNRLHDLLFPELQRYWRGGRKRHETTMKLSCALRYFAGGSSWDIQISHGIPRCLLYPIIWEVVDRAINYLPVIQFPESYEKQQEIADGFKKRSACGIDCCCGCIDGMLVWLERPSKTSCKVMKCGPEKFNCSRKGKYGLNLQAVCDHERRFLEFSMTNPGAASDFISFYVSGLNARISTADEAHPFIKPGLSIFGDNAYVNDMCMTVPFLNARSGEDDFNFYHSQVSCWLFNSYFYHSNYVHQSVSGSNEY